MKAAKPFDPYSQRKMSLLYEIFPYPNRPFFVLPKIEMNLDAHVSFSKSVAKGDWDFAKKVWSSLRAPAREFRNSHLLQMSERLKLEDRILLAGCGTDEPLLFHMLHPQCNILGIDLSSKSVRIASLKLRLSKLLPSQWRVLFAQFFSPLKIKLPKLIASEAGHYLRNNPSEKFTHIQCFGVLHHQQNPREFFSSLCRSLEPGGTLRMMIYSNQGRRLERRIQQRYDEIWTQALFTFAKRLRLRFENLKLTCWQVMNKFRRSSSAFYRFKYMGSNKAQVADALMHPSDPGLDPSHLLSWFAENGMSLVFCEAKVSDEGRVAGFENANDIWKNIVEIDKKQGLLSNIVFVLKKESRN